MTIYSAVGSNKRKTWLVMILFILFFFMVSYILGRALGYGLSFAGVMLIISGFMSFGSYYYSDKLVIASSGAKEVTKEDYHDFVAAVEDMAIAAGLPTPRTYVVEDPSPNAFATGRDPKHAAVVATTGLLQVMKKAELEGVIGHELSHVKDYDTRLMGVVAILVGSIAILADVFMRSLWFGGFKSRDDDRNSNSGIFMILALILAILAPIAATLIQLAVSRRREYLADANGALLTRYPEGLASALEKIAANPMALKRASNATAHLYIENPFKADTGRKTSWLMNLFSTHPPVEDRIRILRSM
ncbi:MAG: M48 family metalloprotease [Candidatus Levyibacteriota bacterium]